MLYEACKQAKRWRDADLPQIRMAVNISGRHFHSSDRLVDVVERALGVTGLAPELLELEVTEGIAVGEEEATARALNQIRDLGVKLAIDDFGTGYSMLGRLRQLPDRPAEDRPFVRERDRRAQRRGPDRLGDDRDGPQPEARVRGRRGRDPGAADLSAQSRLRPGARFPLQPSGRGGRHRAPVATPSVGYNLTAAS